MDNMKEVPLGHMDYKFEILAYGVGGDEHLAVVLGRNMRDKSMKNPRFVVWYYNRQSDGFTSGHYTNDENDATEVFMRRTKRCRGMK